MCDMKITLSVNEQVVAEAREIASAQGTSLNQLICDYLTQLTQRDHPERTLTELESLWRESTYASTGTWSRDELHERS